LKQARHLASRLFLNEGARSSLPQYLQTSFSVMAADRDACGLAFLVFEVGVGFGSATTVSVSALM
jgi:hypothetical protein